MEKTPVRKSKLSRIYKQNNSLDVMKTISTSPQHSVDIDSDVHSPLQIPLTQDALENVDVVWDWNSPQGKPLSKKAQKRIILPPSPKVPIKRHPSYNSIQNFEKLRGELQALREEIAIPENEDLLSLSPVEEADYKNIGDINSLEEEFQKDSFEELFSSPVKAELIKFDEDEIGALNNKDITKKNYADLSPKSISFKKIDKKDSIIANDSFEALLGEVDIDQLTCSSIKKATENYKSSELRAFTMPDYNICESSGKVEFHRTKSFELSNVEQITGIPKEQLNDIERKRREALAKLSSKRKQDLTVCATSQCSMEEIEKKRRQALAKLEAKREQEIIERKRQEALKRLQSRRKNAPIVKGVLTKRLDYEIS